MSKNLMIVESPAKAKTIEKFLGNDFIVESCYGCIRDLPREKLAVDVEKEYLPTYEVPGDKKKIVTQLKKLAKETKNIWLATDEDREGEAISWHLCHVLGVVPEKARRIVFHEITEPAIIAAIKKPRKINQDLVNAQQARRILDRLVGFELSPLLWKKIRLKSSLSAGRVQSVAVRLIVEKEKEIQSFNSTSFYRVNAIFIVQIKDKTYKIKSELARKLESVEEAKQFLQKCINATFSVKDVQVKPSKKSPTAPFTTSTLQQEASRKLGFSVGRTMSVAQKLYEAGKITYMRTDSVNLSETAIEAAKKEIITSFGPKYSRPQRYKSKSRNAQEAHEAIRPTYFKEHQISSGNDEKKLYDLIWKRAISSQMTDAIIEKTNIKIAVSTTDDIFSTQGEVIQFDGFLKVYEESSDDESAEFAEVLPPLKKGEKLNLSEMIATQRFTRATARYTEATLVKKLEELGIGRPSTYAPTMSVIQKRGYVHKGESQGQKREYQLLTLKNKKITQKTCEENHGSDKGRLVPTDIGILVNDFLTQYFEKVMEYDFTAQIEKEFDEIAQGEKVWNQVIDNFYCPFHDKVESALKEAKQVTGERKLGIDPKSKKEVFVKVGRYGPMAQIGSVDDEEKPKFAKLRPHQHIATIELEEALELFNLPRNLGEYEGLEIIVSEGRFGPYAKHGDKFASIGKNDPLKITLEEAIEIIVKKQEADAKKNIKEFPDSEIKILNGPYGPYISHKRKNYRIAKNIVPEQLTEKECLQIIEETSSTTKTKKSKTSSKKTTTAKKAATSSKKTTTAKKSKTSSKKTTTAKKAATSSKKSTSSKKVKTSSKKA